MSIAEKFIERVKKRDVTVGIVGLGYVGIPLAITALKQGFKVQGFDIDAGRVASLNSGSSTFKHIPTDVLRDAVKSGKFEATADFSRLGEPDAILIAVPTPLNKYREPDLSYVVKTTEAIGKTLRKGQLIVLESTTYPGTTDEIMRVTLEKMTGLVSGKDFFLAFSPEREDPGNAHFGTATIPKVVGGDGADALSMANTLYGHLVERTVPVSSTATAEAVKLTENIFRAVNIALVNELKVVYANMGVDVWEVIDAAKTKPFGFMPFYPGPGLGGHCIPIDPFYLTWKAREFGITTRFIELAGQINTAMPEYVVGQLVELLDTQLKRSLSTSKILILGIAYKKNIEDMRESPALHLISLLEKRGAKTEYHDPYIPSVGVLRDHPEFANRKSVDLSKETLASFDAVLIVTDHDDVDYRFVAENSKLVVDTRNVCAKADIKGKHIFKA